MLLIAIALLSIAPEQVQDNYFTIIQEDWVYKAVNAKDLDQVMPHRQATLIRSLGCIHYSCREMATELIREENQDNLKALVWGYHHKDQEIVAKCESLLDQYLACRHCDGTRVCPRPLMPVTTDLGNTTSVCIDCRYTYGSTNSNHINELYAKGKCLTCFAEGYVKGTCRWLLR